MRRAGGRQPWSEWNDGRSPHARVTGGVRAHRLHVCLRGELAEMYLLDWSRRDHRERAMDEIGGIYEKESLGSVDQ